MHLRLQTFNDCRPLAGQKSLNGPSRVPFEKGQNVLILGATDTLRLGDPQLGSIPCS